MLGRIKDAFRVLVGNRGGSQPQTNPTATEPRLGLSYDEQVRRYVLEFQSIMSDVMAQGDHKPEDCPNCLFQIAAKNNEELMQMMGNCVSHICEINPFILLQGMEGARPVVQSLFDVWCMAALCARKATINEIEKGELEVWKSTDKAAGATGK